MATRSRQCGRCSWVRCDGTVTPPGPPCWSAAYWTVADAVDASTATPHPVHRISPVGPQPRTRRSVLYRNALTLRSRHPGAGPPPPDPASAGEYGHPVAAGALGPVHGLVGAAEHLVPLVAGPDLGGRSEEHTSE